MENEIGEYIRTKTGYIGKCYKISTYKINNKDKTMYLAKFKIGSYGVNITDIVKHSKYLIDLIEVGDYVNGILVTGKEGTLLYTEIKGIDRSSYHIPISQYGENIKDVVTREQFEQMKYIVEE